MTIEETQGSSGNVDGAGPRPVPPKRERATPPARAIPAPSKRLTDGKDGDGDKGKGKKEKRLVSDAELRRLIGLPLKGAFGAWATFLHDDYYRLSDEELSDLVDPAIACSHQFEFEDQILKFAAPAALATSMTVIVADRVSYMLSPEGPDEASDFDSSTKPEIRRTGQAPARAESPQPQPINGYEEAVPATNSTTREGRLPDITRGPLS